ncbi:MAG: U32 family peptidase, partial [Desulfosarcinaceae bacterium]
MGAHLNKGPELLAPAGNFEKLEIVLHYGADAIYLAGKDFSLRSFSSNFSLEEMRTAFDLVHSHGAKAYVTVNIYARNQDLPGLERYLRELGAMAPDGLIISDPAVLLIARRTLPDVPLHLSTQANTTNAMAAQFWQSQGVKRINVARELSLKEITRLAEQTDLEIEAFVHGAMCISYSGRCLLSNFMAQRPSNQGMCCQPCRFKYALVEETRPGQYFPIDGDHRGTYILNSKDLCMLAHLPEMLRAGIRTLKIEGRMKGINYAATTVKIYREALDHLLQGNSPYRLQDYWQEELNKVTSRGYCTGFYLGDKEQTAPGLAPPKAPETVLVGKVLSSAGRHMASVEVRNQIRPHMPIEILKPSGPVLKDTVDFITDDLGQNLAKAQPGQHVILHLHHDCSRLDLLRLDAGDKNSTGEGTMASGGS